MNSKLIALLLIVGGGSLPNGKTFILYTPAPGVSRVDLVDAGIGTDCNRKNVRVQTFNDPQCATPYCAEQMDVAVCPLAADAGVDFGVIVKPRVAPYIVTDPNWTGNPTASTLAVDQEVPDTFTCACAPSDGGCTLTDGGAPARALTYPAASLTGAACIPKPCVEMAGTTSMPSACQ